MTEASGALIVHEVEPPAAVILPDQDVAQSQIPVGNARPVHLTTGPTRAGKERLAGRVILLLDGLDEVDEAARRWILKATDQFALTHVHTPILVTCRVYAYQDAGWRLSRFQQATLAPFDEEKIGDLIEAWYAV